MRISPDEPLTKGAFSSGRGKSFEYRNNLNNLFNAYKKYGDLFLLININDIKDLYMFNCGEGTFFGIFKYDGNQIPMNPNVAKLLESLDYSDVLVEKWILQEIDKWQLTHLTKKYKESNKKSTG